MRRLKRASILLVFLLVAACSHNPPAFDEEKWRKDVENASIEKLYAPHYQDGKYFNPWLPQERGGFLQFLKWKLGLGASYTPEEEAFLPGFIPELKKRIQTGFSDDFIAWIGHGSFLLRLDGQYWLTDPIFTDRAFLPKRVTPPALTAV
jgi:N-acyl-phosphatidylethanolamine-hydrolysing phospholipase D